jgi:hypothetical protein
MYDHPLPKHKVHRSKKQYDRKLAKARLKKGELYFWLFITGVIRKKRVTLTFE